MKEQKWIVTYVVVFLQKRGNLKNHIELFHEGKKPFKCIITESNYDLENDTIFQAEEASF